jgi:hypothetical protein
VFLLSTDAHIHMPDAVKSNPISRSMESTGSADFETTDRVFFGASGTPKRNQVDAKEVKDHLQLAK